MLSTLLLTILFVDGNLALNENGKVSFGQGNYRIHLPRCYPGVSFLIAFRSEWRDTAVELYYNYTKYFSQHDYDTIVDLFWDDIVELYPDGPAAGKRGMKPIMEKIPFRSEYFGFLELLYSSPDVVITRHVAYRKLMDGKIRKFKGLVLLVKRNERVRVKMGAFNSYSDYSD